MPIPVPAWSSEVPFTAKSLNLSLYTADGSGDNPTGISFIAYKPVLFETYTSTTTFPGASGGTTSVMSTSGSITTCKVVLDTAGYFGQTSDAPGKGFYQYTPVIAGSAGDGVTPGGWMVLSHVAPLVGKASQTAVSAGIIPTGGAVTVGSAQAPSSSHDSAPFFCDLVNTGSFTWQPTVTIRDSSGSATTNPVNSTDSSGETPRFYAVWAAVSATTNGQATYTVNGTYEFTAPAGITSVTPAAIGAGAGAGGGNVSGGGIEYGGGGGGAGEFASGAVAVTGLSNYPVIVGAGGAGGAAPGASGGAGGNSSFAGDSVTVTAHGGSAGAGATTGADGAGGAGGTGSAASTHHNGGAGATGSTGTYGGGGGSSAGTAVAGNAANSASGAPAPVGGGPGGAGGSQGIRVVQSGGKSVIGLNPLTMHFAPLQAGNGLVVCTAFTGTTGSDPTVILSDGTPLSAAQTADFSGTDVVLAGIYAIFGVTGGQASVTVTGSGALDLVTTAQFYEVAGLGSSPATDVSSGTTAHNAGSYATPPLSQPELSTNGGPDFWVGCTAAQAGQAFDINPPGQPDWNVSVGQNGDSRNGNHLRLRSGYQIRHGPGSLRWSGSFSGNANHGTPVIAWTTSATTPGASPVIGPGGGGGGGLGAASAGADGLDGSVTLTWTEISGSGYGTPPLPAPYTNWGPLTTIGTSATSPNVDINSAAGITDVVNFLCNPPVFRISGTAGQSIGNASVVAVAFSGASPTVDSYSGWSSGTYTVQRAGLYLFHGLACFAANSTGTRQAGADINGTTYWGPGYKAASSGTTNATKTQVFSLQAGDTVKLTCRQDSGGSLALDTTAATRFLLVWLTTAGTPAVTLTPPDTTFRWAAGTSSNLLPALMQQHLGNDLGFLCNVPYLLAYQATPQSGLTAGSFSTVTMDTVAGIVHNDAGDNYAGWTAGASNLYTAQVEGWVLMVAEYFTTSSASSGSTAIAAILPSTSGGATPHTTPDWFQQSVVTATASVGGGCTVIGLTYLEAGESITPQLQGLGFPSPYGTLTGTSNGGVFASHLECLWISE